MQKTRRKEKRGGSDEGKKKEYVSPFPPLPPSPHQRGRKEKIRESP